MKPPSPVQEIKGDNVVCILFNDRKFKTEVVDKISKSLKESGYEIVTDRVKRSKYYNASDYGAVVYMAELWAWHTPWHAVKYYRKNNRAQNIVFVITSGDPHVIIKEPFDAVTSPSRHMEVDRVSQKITERLSMIIR